MDYLVSHPLVVTALACLALLAAAAFANFVVKVLLVRGFTRLLANTPLGRDEEVMGERVIPRLANVVPALVLSLGASLVPGLPEAAAQVVENVANASIVLSVAMAIGAAINVADTLYRRKPVSRDRPIKGYLQVLKIALYVIAAILILSVLVDRSPVILLSGLGAMAAVLMLVFQDTLLSLVASMQISAGGIVRVGDWIEVPHLDADGEVTEIALYTVKVQNWDKTITVLPTRKLITDRFKNWRGMQESGGRRIKRSLLIDQNTIHFLSDDEAARLSSIGLIEGYLAGKAKEIAEWNGGLGEKAKVPANRRQLTNIGTFRAYVERYLRSHKGVHQGMTLLVRQMQPTPEGLPIEVYCFAKTVAWADYEGVQSDIFDHLYAIMPEFSLRTFQKPAGRDVSMLAEGSPVPSLEAA